MTSRAIASRINLVVAALNDRPKGQLDFIRSQRLSSQSDWRSISRRCQREGDQKAGWEFQQSNLRQNTEFLKKTVHNKPNPSILERGAILSRNHLVQWISADDLDIDCGLADGLILGLQQTFSFGLDAGAQADLMVVRFVWRVSHVDWRVLRVTDFSFGLFWNNDGD